MSLLTFFVHLVIYIRNTAWNLNTRAFTFLNDLYILNEKQLLKNANFLLKKGQLQYNK
jgi:hypothetical protein